MRFVAAAVIAVSSILPGAAVVFADGSLPPQPYQYLHPPPALAGSNTKPGSGELVGSVAGGLSTAAGYSFTSDGQAGIVIKAKGVRVALSDTSFVIQIRPVETPPGLPPEVVADGNAYQFAGTGRPSGKPATLTKPATIILKWPHVPLAIYLYSSRKWKQLCYSAQATFTPSTISCSTHKLGIAAAVAQPSSSGIPTTPASKTPFAWINTYIPIAAAALVCLLALVLGYIVTRPDKGASPGDSA